MPLLIPPCIPPEKLVMVIDIAVDGFNKDVVMFRTTHFAAGKAGAKFKTMYGVDAQHSFAQFGMEFIKNRLAQTNRAIFNITADFAANSIALFADAVDIILSFLRQLPDRHSGRCFFRARQ